MKKLLLTVPLALAALWPLACANRPFSTPVRPVLPTPTPQLVCTATPGAQVTAVIQGSPVTNTSFSYAQGLGTLTTVEVEVAGTLQGSASAPGSDYYSFTAGNSGSCTIYVDCFEEPPTPALYAYNSSEALEASDADASGLSAPMVTYAVTGGQLYYVQVSGYGGQAYTLKLFVP